MSSSKWQPLNGLARKGTDSPRGPGRPGRSRTAMRCPLATASAPISHSDCQCRELGRVRHECWESFISPLQILSQDLISQPKLSTFNSNSCLLLVMVPSTLNYCRRLLLFSVLESALVTGDVTIRIRTCLSGADTLAVGSSPIVVVARSCAASFMRFLVYRV